MYNWEPPCGCLESIPGLLWEQGLLNVKSSLQPRKWICLRKNMLLNLTKHYFIIYLSRAGRSLLVRTGEQGHSSPVAIRRQMWQSEDRPPYFMQGLCVGHIALCMLSHQAHESGILLSSSTHLTAGILGLQTPATMCTFTWILEIWALVLIGVRQVLCPVSHLPDVSYYLHK